MNMPKNDTEKFLSDQKAILFHEFTHGSHCVIASSPRQLRIFERLHGWRIEPLPGTRNNNALIVRREHAIESPQCWVKWNYTGYRGAFRNFLNLYFADYKDVLNPDVHVDHLQARYLFSKGVDYYVRLYLVPKDVNARFGAGFERSFLEWERERHLKPAMHMCWLSYCKTQGIIPPTKSSGILEWKSWAHRHARSFSEKSGEHGGLAYLGLLSVLQLGYTKYYSGSMLETVNMEQMIAEYVQACGPAAEGVCQD